MTTNEQMNYFINHEDDICRLIAAIGADDARKVTEFVFDEKITDGDIGWFIDRIGIAEEKRRIRWGVTEYLARHPKGERAYNDAEFIDEIVELTYMLRDEYIEGLVSDIEAAILCIAIGDHEVKEERFVEMAKSLFPIYTK